MVTLLLVLNPMEEMVVQVVIRLMSLTCSLMEAVAGIGFVFFFVWGNQTAVWFGFGVVGFCLTPVSYPLKINDWKGPDFLLGPGLYFPGIKWFQRG